MRFFLHFLLGAALGAAYLALLWVSVRLLVAGARGGLYALLVPLRFGLLAAAFILLLRREGPLAGPLALAGLVAVRLITCRLVRPGEVRP